MNANTLKLFYEKMPKGVKFFLSPLFIRAMVDNKIFKETLDEIKHFESLEENARRMEQLDKLKKTLVYAFENVPFYRERFNEAGFNPYSVSGFEDVRRIPILEKQEAIKAGDSILSTEGSLDFYETFTGGSSGQALKVLLDKASIYRERAYVCNFLSKFEYDPKRSKTVALFGHNKDKDYYYSPLKNEIVISPFRLFDETGIKSIIKDIRKFGGGGSGFLMGYPSAISELARLTEKFGETLRFKHIVFYAENYSLEDKTLAERVFGCKADSYYGHTERAVFAEIVDDECFFSDSYGYTELIPTDLPNEYRVVCTGFISRKMPLIRYATDDVIQIDEGGKRRLIGHKRSEVYLVAKNGAHIFKGAMTLHVPELSGITRYQYYQCEPGKATLRLMTQNPLDDSEQKHLESYLARRTEGLLDVDVQYVEEIELTPRGKERWAIVEIPEGE